MTPLPPDRREWRAEHYIELGARLARGDLSVPEAEDRYGVPAATLQAWKAHFLAWAEHARAQLSGPAHLSEPRDLEVQRSMDALTYTLTDWDSLPGWPLALSGLGFLLGFVMVAISSISSLVETIAILLILQPFLSFPLALLYARLRHRASITIDPRGLTRRGIGGVRRLSWGDYTAVRRQGRTVSVRSATGWVRLPSPTAYVDAMWLERIALEGIAANAGASADALPPELAALRDRALPPS